VSSALEDSRDEAGDIFDELQLPIVELNQVKNTCRVHVYFGIF
jgi:hypothetical protein